MRLVVGMSGGVDSSVAAAMLLEEGHEVIGVTLHLAGSDSRCCSLDDADDARRVADRLGIRFYVANYKDRFHAEVIEPFADAYLAGRTPIPCVACNKRFKFDYLLARGRALGADGVATGHYARVEAGADGTPRLLRGEDARKDQSYFLFNLAPEQLARIRFPLGGLGKDEVRDRARALGLVTADKPESQEICFVPDGDYAKVVERIRPGRAPGKGDVVDQDGTFLGHHSGIHRYTVGQRRGLGLSGTEPRYVIRIDAAANRVVVGPASALAASEAFVEDVSWTRAVVPSEPLEAQVKIRYRDTPVPALVAPDGAGGAHVRFEAPVRAVTPGQAAVFYAGEEVLGGGWIAGGSA